MGPRHEPRGIRRAPHQRQAEFCPETFWEMFVGEIPDGQGSISPKKRSGMRGEVMLQPRTFELEREARPRLGDMSPRPLAVAFADLNSGRLDDPTEGRVADLKSDPPNELANLAG